MTDNCNKFDTKIKKTSKYKTNNNTFFKLSVARKHN